MTIDYSVPSERAPGSDIKAAQSSDATLLPPLIIVEGFLSPSRSVVWGNEFRTYLGVGHQQFVDDLGLSEDGSRKPSIEGKRKRRSHLGSNRLVVFAPIGPVSSIHDRACELFYALRGGTVDYGAAHAEEHGHARFGRHFETALCPVWGKPCQLADGRVVRNMPAHFLGHSLGGPTILKLQQLLRQGFFDHALGYDPTLRATDAASDRGGDGSEDESAWKPEDLVLSVTSISSPFRGTPLVYSLGSEPVPEPRVRFFSLGNLIAKAVHVAAYLDLPFFDAHADAWHFSRRRLRMQRRVRTVESNSVTCVREEEEEEDEEIEANASNGLSRKKATRLEDEETSFPLPPKGGQGDKSGVRQDWQGLSGLFRQLWKSDWAEGRDCAPWDCTLGERERCEDLDGWGLEPASGRTPRTWYRSYAGSMTTPATSFPKRQPDGSRPLPHQRPDGYWNLSPFTLTSHLIGRYDYGSIQPPPRWLEFDADGTVRPTAKLQEWYSNDGVVPLASQYHPGECSANTCIHSRGIESTLVATPPMPTRRDHGTDGIMLCRREDGFEAERGTRGEPMLQNLEEGADLEAFPPSSHRRGLPSASGEDEEKPSFDAGWEAEAGASVLARTEVRPARPSLVRGARHFATVAVSTTLRAFGMDNAPLRTPADEDLDRFLPRSLPASERIKPIDAAAVDAGFTDNVAVPMAGHERSLDDGSPSDASERRTATTTGHVRVHQMSQSSEQQDGPMAIARGQTNKEDQVRGQTQPDADAGDRAATATARGGYSPPQPNLWYTVVLDDTDHATLCPFWTGSDVQKRFWTGIGLWTASVDFAAGHRAASVTGPE